MGTCWKLKGLESVTLLSLDENTLWVYTGSGELDWAGWDGNRTG